MCIARSIILIALSFCLSGCFLVDAQYRQKVSVELGKSSWPVLSGKYGTSQNKEMIVRRSIDKDGKRNYVDKEDNHYYLYRQSDEKYVVEISLAVHKEQSIYVYADIYDTKTFAYFSSDCKDLSPSQRKYLFGNAEIGRCGVTNKRDLIFLLDKSLQASPNVKAIYKLKETMADKY